jgi:hypothetical protein
MKWAGVSFLVLSIGMVGIIGCGGGGGASVSSLSQLPDPQGMVSTSSSTTGLSRATVSGTAPLITALKADADTDFWNGLIAQINDASFSSLDTETKRTKARQFWGGQVSGPSGQGGCFMAQNVGQVFGRMLESGTSACYMKNMPSASSGVTITPTPSGGASNLFAQQADDVLVKVSISGSGGDEHQPEQVFIKVYGSKNVTSDVYKAQLYFCASGAVNGTEIWEVNKSTMAYTASSIHKDSDQAKFSSSTSATLKAGSGDALEFDTSKDRTVSMNGKFGTDGFAAKITITSDNLIYSLMNHYNSGGGGGAFVDKNSSVAEFSGTDVNSVRFLAGGFSGLQKFGSFDSRTYSGALEWRDTYYMSIDPASSSLYTKAAATDLSTDSFFTSLADPSVDFSGLSCDVTPDYTVTMDFSNSVVAAIRTSCEGKAKVKGSDNDYCWAGAVQQASQVIQTLCNSGGC